MGNVRINPNGYLYFDFYFKGKRYKEYSKLENSTRNMKQAEDTMAKINAEIKLGTFDSAKYFPDSERVLKVTPQASKSDVVTFEEYADTWNKINKISWKPSFQRDVHSILDRHLIPGFKGKALTDITKWSIKKFRTSLSLLDGKKGQKLSNKTINNILQVLQLIMNEASDEHNFDNPFANLKPLKVRKPVITPLSLNEVFKFLQHVPELFNNYYVVRFFTGMRTAEVDGLKWQFVDFENRKILVRDTWQNKKWVSPKTESSVRDIDMSKKVEDALRKQKEVTGDAELVFLNKKKNPLDYNDVTKRIWYPTLKKAGLAPRAAYQSRHTAATMWLGCGENPEWVARQLGHSNTEMLFKVYSKFIPNLTRRDGSAFEKFLDSKLEEHNNKQKNKGEENK